MATTVRASSIAGTVGIRVIPILEGVGKILADGAKKDGAEAGRQYAKAHQSEAIKLTARQKRDVYAARQAEAQAINDVTKAQKALNAARKVESPLTMKRAEADLAKARADVALATNRVAGVEHNLAQARKAGDPARVEQATRRLTAARLTEASAQEALTKAVSRHAQVQEGQTVYSERAALAQDHLSAARNRHATVIEREAKNLALGRKVYEQDIALAKANAAAQEQAMSTRQRVAAQIRQNIAGMAEHNRVAAKLNETMNKMQDRRVRITTDADTSGLKRAAAGMDEINLAAGGIAIRMGALLWLLPMVVGALVPIGAAALGVAGALGTMAAAGAVGAGALVLALKPVAEAYKAMQNAEKQAAMDAQTSAKAQSNAARQVASARKGVNDAARAGAQATRAALAAQVRAERSVATAQRDAKRAQEDLTKARRTALQQIRDLRAEAEDAALNERDAQIQVERAQERLLETRIDPKSTGLDRREAQLSLDQALLRQRRVREEAKTAREEAAEAQRKGVEGSDVVKSALERLSDSQERVAEAEKAAAAAAAEVARTRVEGAERVREAQARLADAQDAAGLASTKLTASQNALNVAMEKLSPTGQQFVRRLMDINKGMEGLSKKSQDAMFPGLMTAMDHVSKHGPTFERIVTSASRQVGDFAAKGGKALAGPTWTGIIDRFEKRLPRAMSQFANTTGNAFEGVAVILDALAPTFLDTGDGIEGMSKKFADWSKEWVKSDGFKDFIQAIKDNAPVVKDFLKEAGRALANLAKSLSPIGKDFLVEFTKFLKWIADQDPQNMETWIRDIGKIGVALAGVGTAMKGLRTAKEIFDTVDALKALGRLKVNPIVNLGAAAAEGAAAEGAGAAAAGAAGGKGAAGAARKGGLLARLFGGAGGAALLGEGAATAASAGAAGAAGGAGAGGTAAAGGAAAAGGLGTVLWPLAIGAAVAGGLVLAYKHIPWFQKGVDDFVKSVQEKMGPGWNRAWSQVEPIVNRTLASTKLGMDLGLKKIGEGMTLAQTGMKVGWDIWGDDLTKSFARFSTDVKTTTSSMFSIIGDSFSLGANVISGNWDGAWKDMQRIASSSSTIMAAQYDTALNVMGTFTRAYTTALGLASKDWQMKFERTVEFVVNNVLGGAARNFLVVSKALGLDLKIPVPHYTPSWQTGGRDKGTRSQSKEDFARRFAKGGLIEGKPAYGYDDRWGVIDGKEPIRVGSGEYIVNARSTQANLPLLEALNKSQGTFNAFAAGGLVRKQVKDDSGGGPVWPTTSRRLSNTYSGHSGIDIPVPIGTPVFAAGPGTVDYVGWGRGYGNAIFQSLSNGLRAVYGHLSQPLVSVGQALTAGMTIARSGNTGRSTGPHLHFEVAPGGFAQASNRAATQQWLGGAALQGGGGGFSLNPLDWIKSLGGKAADAAGWVWDKAGAAVSSITEKFGNNAMAKISVAALNKIISGAKDKFLSVAESQVGEMSQVSDPGAPGGGNAVERWRSNVIAGLRRQGVEPTNAMVNLMLHRIGVESGGNPRAINNWDINARRGDPSRGLLQTIMATFKAYHDPSLPFDIYNPDSSIAASIRYVKARYKGNFQRAYGGTKGYAEGGLPKLSDLPRLTWDINPGTTGVMPPGFSLAYNGTGAPERLTREGGGTNNNGIIIDRPVFNNTNANEVVDELFFKIRSKRSAGRYGRK